MKRSASSPFSGFPGTALPFLRRLKKNNDREWFLSNRTVYEQSIRSPMTELVNLLAVDFSRFAPEIAVSPKTSMYRIHRDTRFSADKSPYKTHVAAVFPPRGMEKHQGAGFYFHFSPDELLIGGGLYMPSPEDLLAVRLRVQSDFREFKNIIGGRVFRRLFGGLEGEQLRRVPRGFAPDDPAADYLRRKQFLAMRTLPAETVATDRFYGALLETFTALAPLIRFLNHPIAASHRLRQRRDALLDGQD
ncbi:MAG TPA: DUF2461 domain-containing protein [Terriglobia bacterium]|nr:DUF2461 domain-containing protein [Terriglobia bacterium]